MISEDKKMSLDAMIQEHVVTLPSYLQAEVYDFVLFLEQKQKNKIANSNEVISLTMEQQLNFVESLLNPEEPNDKLKKLAKSYLAQINE